MAKSNGMPVLRSALGGIDGAAIVEFRADPIVVKTCVANRRGVHAGVHARRRYDAAKAAASLVFAGIEVRRARDEWRKPGQSRGLIRREHQRTRIFRKCPRAAMELFLRGRQFT